MASKRDTCVYIIKTIKNIYIYIIHSYIDILHYHFQQQTTEISQCSPKPNSAKIKLRPRYQNVAAAFRHWASQLYLEYRNEKTIQNQGLYLDVPVGVG